MKINKYYKPHLENFMQDIYDLVKNIDDIYNSNTAFTVLKDFERVLDELDLYVYDNWSDGELCQGPKIERHWVTCSFMWPRDKMPDPMGGKRLIDYDCKVFYKKDHFIQPRKIETPDDIRPHTKKGKLDRKPVWVVTIQMPKSLVVDIYTGYAEEQNFIEEPAVQASAPEMAAQPADVAATAAPEGETI